MCRLCEMNEKCPKTESYPLISPISYHIITYMNEIDSGYSSYPNGGTWELQPVWFMSSITLARNTLARCKKAILEEEQSKYGK